MLLLSLLCYYYCSCYYCDFHTYIHHPPLSFQFVLDFNICEAQLQPMWLDETGTSRAAKMSFRGMPTIER